MIRNIIKYLGIALVIIGIFLVMRNLISKDTDWSNDKGKTNNKNNAYNVTIKLLDKDNKKYLAGSKLILKNTNDELIAEWTTNEEAYVISNLENGNYTLIQIDAPDNYHLNEAGVTFELKNKDKEITMYNTKMTEEEIKQANTTNTEVGVDNTASNKSIFTSIIAIITTVIGISLIYKTKENY